MRSNFVYGLVTATALASASATSYAGAPRQAPGPSIAVPGELVLVSLTVDAVVEIDGKVVGTVPLEQFTVLPGTHTIRLSKRGYATATQDFEVLPGETVELELDLVPFAGIVTIQSSPAGASVKVDGKVLGVTPLDTDIAAGTRQILVALPGYQEEARQVEVRAAAELALDFQLKPVAVASSGPAFYETWWFWTLVGVAGAGTAAAVIATSGSEVTPRPDLELRIP